ncbi:MAG: hypothetical protein GWN62_31230 [Aliifodinibius sp.]|nr:hypothetical protein [Fodinibius sp.]
MEPGNLVEVDNTWFVFLESVDRSDHPARYDIYGQQIIMNESILVDSYQGNHHFGTYYSTHLTKRDRG